MLRQFFVSMLFCRFLEIELCVVVIFLFIFEVNDHKKINKKYKTENYKINKNFKLTIN